MTQRPVDLAVIGAGVIGLSVAWRAALDGLSVAVCDPDPARGASWAAAGMIAPSTEARWGEEPLHQLSEDSAARWPDFAAQLEEDSGSIVGLRREGTVSVAFDADDYRALAEAVEVQRRLGCPVELLTGRECRQLEPALNPRTAGGALSPGDHQVDNRAVLQALLEATARRGVRLERRAVEGVQTGRAGTVTGVVLRGGTEIPAAWTVLAAGCYSGRIGGLAPEDVPAVRPVKGQILRLRTDPANPILTKTVRATAQGRSVYLVPRLNGELVVGATMEEQGFDTTVTAGAVYELLRAATAAVPDVGELELTEATARLRPGSPNNGPTIGAGQAAGLLVATGHFRHGVLLAPVTADTISATLSGDPIPVAARAFGSGQVRSDVLEPAGE